MPLKRVLGVSKYQGVANTQMCSTRVNENPTQASARTDVSFLYMHEYFRVSNKPNLFGQDRCWLLASIHSQSINDKHYPSNEPYMAMKNSRNRMLSVSCFPARILSLKNWKSSE